MSYFCFTDFFVSDLSCKNKTCKFNDHNVVGICDEKLKNCCSVLLDGKGEIWLKSVSAVIASTEVTTLPQKPMFKESNKYNLGNWSLMFASISGQVALASSFISHFGPHLPLLFKLH